MFPEATKVNLQQEAKTMAAYLEQGNPCASIYLARLIEADTLGALRPFAEALAARLSDHLNRYAELGITDPDVTLQDEVYQLIQTAAMDWAGDSGNDQPCEAT